MWKEFKTLGPYFKEHWKKYFFGLLILVLVDAAQLLIPQFIKQSIDTISNGVGKTQDLILPILLSIIGVAFFIGLGRYFWRFFIHGASRRIEADMRRRLFQKLMYLPTSFYSKNTIGDLMARATNDMNAIRMASGMAAVAFIDGVFMSTAILIVLISQNPQVSLYTIIPLPFVTFLIILFGRLVGKRFRKIQEDYSDMSTVVQESLQGVRVVKSFVKEPYFAEKFEKTNDNYKESSMKLVMTFGFFFPFVTFLGGLSTLILLLVGGTSLLQNKMSPGDLTAMLTYLEMLLWPMLGAGFTVNMMQRGATSLKRVNAILNLNNEAEIAEGNTAHEGELYAGDIEIKNLSLSFEGAKKEALKDVSLSLREGKCLGILGKIGSGKSVLIKSLARLIEPPKGSIFLGGVDIGSWPLSKLRSQMAFVPQDSFLFSASIKENILFAHKEDDAKNDSKNNSQNYSKNFSTEEMNEILKIAALDKDLALFPKGIETIVGERGLTLSGGQKQRVAIARALALDPPILVMDDALSAVDTETEEAILKNLMEKRKGKTTIIISNRVSTLKRSDIVAVFDAGVLTQMGPPSKLAKEKGFFAEVARMQALSESSETNEPGETKKSNEIEKNQGEGESI